MSAQAARAAEALAQLSSPVRLTVLATLAARGAEGASLAELAYAADLPVAKVGDACSRLVAAGLATGSGNGFYRARLEGLREAAAAVDRLQPIAPLLAEYPQLRGNFAHGRLTSLPPTLSDRYELIGELFARFLALDSAATDAWSSGRRGEPEPSEDGLYEEAEINRRLAVVADDVAGVRRMLVDTGWLERDRAGTTYGAGRRASMRS